MRAIVHHTYGDADVLRLADVPRPVPGPGQILIRVRAAGVDRGAWHAMTGLPLVARAGFGLRAPRNPTPGIDLAGRVEAIGDRVPGFSPGDEVFGCGTATWAEYALATPNRLLHRPASLSAEQAAALPTSGATALRMLGARGEAEAGFGVGERGVGDGAAELGERSGGERSAGGRSGDGLPDGGRPDGGRPGGEGSGGGRADGRAEGWSGGGVLVIGAGGGVGSLAVILAKARGERVTAVCSGRKVDAVRSLGADRVIDYTREALSGTYDLIVDIAGNRSLAELRGLLSPRGRLMIAGGEQGGR